MSSRNVGRLGLVAILACFCLLWANAAHAQAETGDIVGTVTDASGAVVPGASVTVTNVATGVSQNALTSSSGDYIFNQLQVGTYAVKVEAKGFKSFTNSGIQLSSGDRARVDAKLEVGESAQTVEVSGTVAPALQTDSSQVGSIVPSQTVEDLPLNGRNLIQLVQLQPGVTGGSPTSIVQGNRPDDRRAISSFSVNGQTDTMNNNMIDGLDNNERIIGTIGVRPSLDAVQEVSVQTNKYDASVGRTGGGVVDVISKSGTNSLHGSAYEFLRNKVLNTNPNYNFLLADNPAGDTATGFKGCATAAACPAAANPAFRQNQYGGSLGGPIKKDKTFFFGDYEGFTYATSLPAASYTVPTLCERGLNLAKMQGFTGSSTPCPDGTSPTTPGDFSDVVPISPAGGGARPAAGTLGPNISNLPTCTTVSTATAGTCIAPMGLAYMSMYPIPNTGSATTLINNYISSPTKTQTADTWDARFDQHFNDKNTFYARFTHNGETTINPNGFPAVHINPTTGLPSSSGVLVNPVVLSYAGPNRETQEQFGGSFVHVYNPNLVLNLKLGVFRSAIDSEPINELSDVSNKLWGFCNPTSCINAESLVPSVVGSGLASISLSSINGGNTLTGIGDTSFIPLREYDTAFQYLGILTWNKGPHSFRFGLSLIRRRATIGQSNNPQGTFTFSGTYTGVAAADLLEGLAITQSRNNALDQPGFRTWEPSGYIQDDWHARPWLTLNLGVRYDIFTPFTEVHGRLSNYDPYLGLLVSPALPGLQQSGNSAMVPTPYHDLAPRFGFAATLPHEAVIRGGFGLTFFPVNYESPYYMKNAPFGFSESCNIQNTGGTVSPTCATAQYGSGAVGQFNNTLTSTYGLAASNTSSTVGQTGGDLMGAGLPVPALNIALATNPANYKANGAIGAIPINLRENYLEQFNLELQKQFGANVVTLGWIGQIGRDVAPLNSATNQNLPANPSENKSGGVALPMVVGGDSYMFGELPGFSYFNSTSTGASEEANIGTSFYNAMQATLVRRFNNGLTVNLGYTWSHMLDNVDGSRACILSVFASPEPCFYDRSNGTGAGLPAPATATPLDCTNAGISSCQNVFGWQRGDWGNGAQDVHDRVSWGINYDLPFAKSAHGVEGVLLKGWGTNIGGSWQTGLPFNVTPAASTTNISGGGYLDQVCSGRASHPTLLQFFNVNCFDHPQTSTLGKMEPNQLFGPSQKNLAFSLVKRFTLTERVNMEFRTEVFNLFNTANFNTPAGTSLAYTNNQTVNITGTSTPAGEITAMNANWAQREIQFALRFTF
jgi:Carboxypeptidase regulatory-like domain